MEGGEEEEDGELAAVGEEVRCVRGEMGEG